MINKPSRARYKYTLNSNNTSEQLSTAGGVELVAVVITAGGSAAAVRVYDSANGSVQPAPSADSFVLAANTGESTCFTPARPINMTKGLYVELEQGADFNGEAFVVYD